MSDCVQSKAKKDQRPAWYSGCINGMLRSKRNVFGQTVIDSPNYDNKWGAFRPSESLNEDQGPLPFVVSVKKTFEYIEPGKNRGCNTGIS